MTNAGNHFISNINKTITTTTTMNQNDRCSLTLNERHEDDLPADNKNAGHLKRNTPILFSTNRGLHLRMANTTATLSAHKKAPLASTNTTDSASKKDSDTDYSIIFCDLERWSTNRANTISLEDTFTMAKSTIVTGSRASNTVRFFPHMPTSVRFNGYSRFDVE